MEKWKSLVQAAKYQIYVSRSHDPFLNLSIEHYLLQKSNPESTILFLYSNRPSIVIGRNQNPWLEVNHDLLKKSRNPETIRRLRDVLLIRRRSGGGTVFHDEGNVNYSVICPPVDFTRDKHAEMVTKAVRQFNTRARVNERHDIVLDMGEEVQAEERPPASDMHRTNFLSTTKARPTPLKISGSAFKMIRNRCLHHGTCLIASPNVPIIGRYLGSPARSFMKARGVESVRSAIGNVSTNPLDKTGRRSMRHSFQKGVMTAFTDMYGLQSVPPFFSQQLHHLRVWSNSDCTLGSVGSEMMEVQEIAEGMEEMKVCSARYGTSMADLGRYSVTEMDLWPNATIHPVKSCLWRG